MTANQLTFQANKIKQQEAATNLRKQELAESQHLHEYGDIYFRNPKVEKVVNPTVKGSKAFQQYSEGFRNIVSPFTGLMR